MIQTIPFGEWLPDLPAYNNPGLTVATNAIPFANEYKQFPGLSTISSNALDARTRGIATFKDKSGNIYTFAGDATKLYSIADNTWSNASKTGNYSLAADDVWEFTQYKERVIAVSYTTVTQSITLGGSAFADLFVSTDKPKAKHVTTIRDFLVLANINDPSDGNVPYRIQWSAEGDPTDMDPSATTLADYQDLPVGGGGVQAIVGGEYGTIFFSDFIYRMTYTGDATIFRFDQIASNIGTIASGSVIKIGRNIYFLDHDGFYVTDGVNVTSIGKNKIDRTFYNDVDAAQLARISSAYDHVTGVVWWAYPTAGTNGMPSRLIGYNIITNRWSKVEIDLSFIFSDRTKGYTLDSLDSLIPNIDTTTVSSFDSSALTGGTAMLGAMTTADQLAYFEGTSLNATFETGDFQPNDSRAFCYGVRPLVEGTSAVTTIKVGTRELLTDSVSYTSSIALNSNGIAPIRQAGGYMRIQATVSGGFDHAPGAEVLYRGAGRR